MTHKSSTLTPADVHIRTTPTRLIVGAHIPGLGMFRIGFPIYMPVDEAVGTFLVRAKAQVALAGDDES